jgi:hypothetical protein
MNWKVVSNAPGADSELSCDAHERAGHTSPYSAYFLVELFAQPCQVVSSNSLRRTNVFRQSHVPAVMQRARGFFDTPIKKGRGVHGKLERKSANSSERNGRVRAGDRQ